MLPIICIALVLRLGHATGGARVLCTDMLRLRKADKKVWLWLLQRYKIVVTHMPKENMLLIYQLAQAHWSTFWWILYGHYAANIHIHTYPNTPRSFIAGLTPSFSANPFHHSLSFILQDWLHGFPGLFTDICERIFFYFLVFLFSTFYLSVPCGRLSWLMSAFERTLK